MVSHGIKRRFWGILAGLFCLTACANGYYINEPICVAYIHHDRGTKDVTWFTGEYAHISPNRDFLNGLTGYVWNAKQGGKLFDKNKEHLPWGYYYVDLEVDGIGHYLKGMAVGNCIFVWPNSLSDKEFEKLKCGGIDGSRCHKNAAERILEKASREAPADPGFPPHDPELRGLGTI
jgi:hypothetical protein